MRLSVTQRLTALWSGLFVVALVLFAALATAFDARSAQSALDDRLLSEAVLAAGSLENGTKMDGDARRTAPAGSALVLYRDQIAIQIIGDPPGTKALRAAAASAADQAVTVADEEAYRVVVHRAGESSLLRVAAFAPQDPVNEEIGRMRRTFVSAALPLVAIAIAAGFFIARRSLSPIDRLTRTAADVAKSRRFSARFEVTTHDELGRLGATFNAMLANLEATYEHERAFIGDISHELRQPLTAIAADAQLGLRNGTPEASRSALDRIDIQAQRLRTLIDDLLMLARADAGALTSGTSEIGECVAEAAGGIGEQFPAAAVQVDLHRDPMPVALDAALAVHLFMNLIRNAAQAARARVVVRVTCEGRDAVVTVEDDGPGIAVAVREQIFRRFERGVGARGAGTGLGLAIASAIVTLAHGTIAVSDSPLGGARFTVRLPVRA